MSSCRATNAKPWLRAGVQVFQDREAWHRESLVRVLEEQLEREHEFAQRALDEQKRAWTYARKGQNQRNELLEVLGADYEDFWPDSHSK